MIAREYDAIITDFANTGFTAYYKKGINIKLSDGITVIDVYKPGMYKVSEEKAYKDAIIKVSGNNKNYFSYQDMKQIDKMVELAIDFLNKENENIIDRDVDNHYELVPAPVIEKKKTSAIRYADLEIGGIYKDNKGKSWVFLGEGEMYKNNSQANRSGCTYLYLELDRDYENKGDNWFYTNDSMVCMLDTYASKKRFFEKVGDLNLAKNKPVVFYDDHNFYSVYHYGVNAVDKMVSQEKIRQVLEEREAINNKKEENIKRVSDVIEEKHENCEDKLDIIMDFDNENEKVDIKIKVGEEIESYPVDLFYSFYPDILWSTIDLLPKGEGTILNVHDFDNNLVFDSEKLKIVLNNISEVLKKNILNSPILNNIEKVESNERGKTYGG